MTKRLHIFLLILLAGVLSVYSIDPQEAIDEFVKKSGVAPSSLAVKVTDLSSGKTLGEHNPKSPLVPASIMKSVTTASLLDKAGADFRYHTRVYIDGPLDMGILRGNLIVVGACDPSLHSSAEPFGSDIFKEILAILREMGIHKIEGEVIVDNSEFAGPSRPASWMPADFKTTYGTGSHALNFRNNVSGNRAVENPDRLFISGLTAALREGGIIVEDKHVGVGKRTQIFDHLSPPVDEIMRSCMMRSDNLFAESMLRTYGKLSGGDGSTADAAKTETNFWKKGKMPMEGVEIIDGSGLSRSNRVTADFMTGVLSKMSPDPVYASFFPLAGQEGTLRKFLARTPLDGYIAMKTGSMKGIQCYAGYKLDDNYMPTHTVVIMMNDIKGSREQAKKAAENMLLKIFNEKNSDSDE